MRRIVYAKAIHLASRLITIITVGKIVDHRANLVFARLIRFYKTFNIIATLLGGLALAVISFAEFHSHHEERLFYAAEGLLTSAALTAVVAITISTMLLFRFEGHQRPTRRDLLIAWSPLVLVDIVILEFAIGLVLWYAGKNKAWRGSIMGSQLAFLVTLVVLLAVWMWNSMSTRGGLGEEELRTTTSTQRVADK